MLPAGATGATRLITNPAGTRLYVTSLQSDVVTVFPLNASGDVAGPGTNAALGAATNFVFGMALR